MDALAWAVILLSAGLLIVVLEVFVPSGGLLGFLAAVALIGSIVSAFMHGPATGLVFIAITLVGLPAMMALALRWWPQTPMGRRMMLRAPDEKEVLPDDPQRQRLRELVGRVGRAKSAMLPSGIVEVDGQTVDATSEGMAIEQNDLVQIVRVRGTRVVVRPADEATPVEPASEDELARPIDTVIPDPFEDSST